MKDQFKHALLLPLAIAACGDDAVTSEPAIELRMTVAIPPGTEAEYCQFVTVPDAWVTRDEVEFTAGSHHVLVYQTPYATIPERKDDGTPVDTSGPFDCSDGATNGWSVTKVIGGSQNSDGAPTLAFPDGVAVRIGGVAMINVHYINALDTPLDTDVRIDFFTVPEADVVEEGDVLFLYNPLIGVAPGTTARARWSCPVYRDITISNAQSHMHARGIGYEARVDGEAPFYVNDQWEGVPVQRYEDFVVRAGSRLDYFCEYRNTESKPIYQGPRTTDEMCMLVGSYHPADPRTARCLDPDGQGFGGEWIGNGTASCAQTLACLQTAQGLPALTDCMLAASPSVARPTSDVMRCLLRATDPAAECGAQFAACAAL